MPSCDRGIGQRLARGLVGHGAADDAGALGERLAEQGTAQREGPGISQRRLLVRIAQFACEPRHRALALGHDVSPLRLACLAGRAEVGEVRGAGLAVRAMARSAVGLVDHFALVHLVAIRVQAPGVAHRIPDLLVAQLVLPRRHHLLHAAVLRDVEQLLQRTAGDYIVLPEGRRLHAKAGCAWAVTLAGRTVAGGAILGPGGLAAQWFRWRDSGVSGRCCGGRSILGRCGRDGQDD